MAEMNKTLKSLRFAAADCILDDGIMDMSFLKGFREYYFFTLQNHPL